MYDIQPNYNAQLNRYLNSLDYAEEVADKADELMAETVIDDIMHLLTPQARREVRNAVLQMAEQILDREAEEIRSEIVSTHRTTHKASPYVLP